MKFSHELDRQEWRALIALSEQACRYPADQTRWLIREALTASGLLPEMTLDGSQGPPPEAQEEGCDHP